MNDHGYTKDEIDRMAGAYYTALHLNDASTPWERLEDWQRHKHRRGVVALIELLAIVPPFERPNRQPTRQSRTVRIDRGEVRATG